ncbi:MAG: PepSY domain-containing protein [Pseudomonas sp.]|jgi:hypothetical protein|nr:PepSY domain-containing protein [Pseudomonas sp.]MDY0414538.1 PepSY domain-containing protein [Pseudomonas sp.]
MKTLPLTALLLAATLVTGAAFADDDCNDPVANWQSRDTLRQMLEAKGWKVQRIKVDDGCYEVKGFDQNGNRIKAEYFPESLRLRKLETKFDKNAQMPEHLYQRNTQQNQEQHNNRHNGDRP